MDELKGIPNVEGLEQLVQSTMEQPKGDEKPRDDKGRFSPPPTGQAELKRLKSFQNPDGTLNLENLDKSYGEIQGYTTKTAQENKELREQLKQMEEHVRLMQVHVQPPVQQPQQQDFDTQFINNPKQAIDNVVNQRVQETLRTATIQDVLMEEQAKNPDEFNERYNFAMLARQQYPNLVNTGAGVRMLFKVADKMRDDSLKRNADKAMKALFGQDVDYEKFKSIVKKDQGTQQPSNDLAYMPDSSGAFRSGTEPGQVNYDKSISSAAETGDVDTVLDGLFKKAGVRK